MCHKIPILLIGQDMLGIAEWQAGRDRSENNVKNEDIIFFLAESEPCCTSDSHNDLEISAVAL